jgi:GTP cyclohydrolase I
MNNPNNHGQGQPDGRILVKMLKQQEQAPVLQNLVRSLLAELGHDMYRNGLRETPERYAKFLAEFSEAEPPRLTVFDSEGYDEMVIVQDITFYSLCEHHIVPFFGTGTIAYIPDAHIIGLSKLPRLLDYYARGLQNQERITQQVAEKLQAELQPKGVAVSLQARHLCMEMRGVRKPGASTRTTCLRGVFKEDAQARQEFLNSIPDNNA